ncbi:MAG: biotin/lipoyl-containing protein, partial [Solirubrobacterales bacterium]
MADSAIVEIQMPQMGESVTEGTILEWHKSEGEFVEEGETVVEVSTDKVDAEVPAPASGVLVKIIAGEDATVEVGSVLGQLDPDGASGNGASAGGSGLIESTGEGDADIGDESVESESPQPGQMEEATNVPPAQGAQATGDPGEARIASPPGAAGSGEGATSAVATGAPVQVVMPEMGESVTEGTVLEWHVAEGEQVAEGDTVVEVSTDKVDAEVPAPAAGTITKLLVQADDTVQVGQVLAQVDPNGTPSGNGASAREPAADPAAPGREAEDADGAFVEVGG